MSMAMKYNMKKRSRMADGGEVKPDPEPTPAPNADAMTKSMRSAFHYANGGACKACGYSEGGEVGEQEPVGIAGSNDHEDMVGSIMKKFSKGGMVANEDGPIADAMPAEYDDLVKDDELEFHETGENSGDELGDEQEDEDRSLAASAFKKLKSKKDKNPKPA